MNCIILEDGERVWKGNFSFIYDKTRDKELFERFLDFESSFKISYIDFAHKLRMAYEAIALQEEIKSRMVIPENAGKTREDIEKEIIKAITNPSSPFNYKKILIRLTRDKSPKYISMLKKYGFWKSISDDYNGARALKKYVQFVYNFASKSSHVNNYTEAEFVPNKENCLRVIESFHDFLCIYYGVQHKFDVTLMPIKGYYAVCKSICEKIGLRLEQGKTLFVKEKGKKICYFIFSSDADSISLNQRRAIDTVNKLWEENFDDPSNIIRQTECISGTNMDYIYQIYSLPGRPLKLIDDVLMRLSIKDRMDIIKGICNGINSMHTYVPPFYHRNINPEAFYIFKICNKYKALLACFDCAKDTGENVTFTVFANVADIVKDIRRNKYFAPELVDIEIDDKVDWEKADIYSLGKTCTYILTGKELDNVDGRIDIFNDMGIEDNISNLFIDMMALDIAKRPTIMEVLKRIQFGNSIVKREEYVK